MIFTNILIYLNFNIIYYINIVSQCYNILKE